MQIEGYGNSWYIMPLCQADNMRGGTFRAFGPFVPVNNANAIIWWLLQKYHEALKQVSLKQKGGFMAKKVTSKKVASQASKALKDGRSSARTKNIAGSALSQREKKSK